MGKIFEELSRIQQELNAPKNLFNKFGNYYYRNAEGILAAVKPLLNGLALVINDEPVCIGDRFYIKATVTLTNGQESVSAVAYAREDESKKGMDGCQITGACSSYARKYALNALLMIDDSKDSDDDSLSPKNPKYEEKPVKKDAPATVKTAATIPQKESPQTFLNNEIAFMGTLRGISDKQKMKEEFVKMRTALVQGGAVPDIPADKITMEQAKNLIDAMYKTFFMDVMDK